MFVQGKQALRSSPCAASLEKYCAFESSFLHESEMEFVDINNLLMYCC